MSAEEPPQQEAANEVEHVNLVEDEEVKDDGKQEDKCDKKEGKKSSPAWEFFDEIKGYPVGFERAKCKFCKVEIGCNSTRNGTSGMMNHLKMVCAKSPLRNNLDKLQKTLQFEKLSKDEKFHNLKFHPDMNKGPGAEDKFKEISAAYEERSDMTTKEADSVKAAWQCWVC